MHLVPDDQTTKERLPAVILADDGLHVLRGVATVERSIRFLKPVRLTTEDRVGREVRLAERVVVVDEDGETLTYRYPDENGFEHMAQTATTVGACCAFSAFVGIFAANAVIGYFNFATDLTPPPIEIERVLDVTAREVTAGTPGFIERKMPDDAVANESAARVMREIREGSVR